MSALITRCPSCSTSFKVTESQLNAAEGSVRCGACLQIFKGSDYISDYVLDHEKVSQSEVSLVEEVQSEDALGEEIEIQLDEEVESEEQSPIEDISEEAVDDVSEEPVDDALEEAGDDTLEEPVDDASEEVVDDALEAAGDDTLEEPVDDASEEAVDDVSEEAGDDALEDPTEDVPEALTEEGAENLSEAPVACAPEESVEVPRKERAETELDEDALSGMPGNINVQDDEPTDIVGEYHPVVSPRKMPWILGIIILLLLSIVQFSWFNRDVLSQHPVFRSYLQYACNTFGCKVAEYSNFELLSVSGLLIRTHPGQDHALQIDAILRNDAVFRQRFPKLQLRFTDINDRTIASRNFSPREYLRGELTGLKFIPASTEVRLALEIVDPDAIGYSMMILPE